MFNQLSNKQHILTPDSGRNGKWHMMNKTATVKA